MRKYQKKEVTETTEANSGIYNYSTTLYGSPWNNFYNIYAGRLSTNPINDLATDLPRWRKAIAYLQNESSNVATVINSFCTAVIGKGLYCIPNPNIKDSKKANETRKALLEYFEEWSNACHIDGQQDFTSILNAIIAAIIRDGDVLVYVTSNSEKRIKIDLISADRIKDPPANLLKKGRQTFLGVQVSNREIEGYWVENNTDKAGFTFFPTFDKTTGLIKSVLLSNPMNTARINSYRGIPVLAASIATVNQLDQLLSSELQANILKTKQTGVYKAQKVGAVKNSMTLPTDIGATKVSDTNILIIPNTDDLTMARGSDISNPNIATIVKIYKEQIAGPFNVSYNVLFNLLEDGSYSTNSTMRQMAWEATTPWRDYLIRNLAKPLYKLVIQWGISSDELTIPNNEGIDKVQFNGRSNASIRSKDIYDANETAIATGQKSIVQICSENGSDAYEIMEQQLAYEAAKKSVMEELGLNSANIVSVPAKSEEVVLPTT